MLRYKTMSAHRQTGFRRAPLLLNVHREMFRPVALRRLEWIGCLHAEATQRTIRHIVCELIQHTEIAAPTQIAYNALKHALDTIYAEAAGQTFTARLFAEIATALHCPGHHAGCNG